MSRDDNSGVRLAKEMGTSYTIFPLGDSALTINFGNTINEGINDEVIARYHQLNKNTIPGIIELIPAYSSLTVCYDPIEIHKHSSNHQTVFEWLKSKLEEKCSQPVFVNQQQEKLVRIPVCYEEEFAPNLALLSVKNKISIEEIIQIHTAQIYKIYMLGFLPGFSYMGEVDDRIACPRKTQPVATTAGSIGIAGKQTGIYPLDSPGGWQIIGRTPLKVFDAGRDEPVLLKAGDRVQFYEISKNEFLAIGNRQ